MSDDAKLAERLDNWATVLGDDWDLIAADCRQAAARLRELSPADDGKGGLVSKSFYDAAHEIYSACAEQDRLVSGRLDEAMQEFSDASNAQEPIAPHGAAQGGDGEKPATSDLRSRTSDDAASVHTSSDPSQAPSLTDLQALCEKATAVREWYEEAKRPGGYREGVGPIGQMLFDNIGTLLSVITALPALIARVAELERDLRELAEDFSEGVQRAVQARLAAQEELAVELMTMKDIEIVGLKSRLATVERAFETKEVRDGVTTSTHARHNLEGAIIDIERQGKADAVSLRTLHRVAAQLAAIERALAPPVTTKESGG